MTGNDNKPLTAFSAENRQGVPNNGFTRRVMCHLSDRTRWISQIWVTFCFTLALAPFSALDGLQQVLSTLRKTLTTIAQSGIIELGPGSLLIAGIMLLYLFYHKICSLVQMDPTT